MKAPRLPSMIRQQYRFKSFDFKPRYYDEEKEKLDRRKRLIKSEVKREESDDQTVERHARMRINIEDNWANRRSRETRKSNIRIAIILAIIVSILLVVKQKMGI